MNKLDILSRKTTSIQNFLLKKKTLREKLVQNQTQHQEQDLSVS